MPGASVGDLRQPEGPGPFLCGESRGVLSRKRAPVKTLDNAVYDDCHQEKWQERLRVIHRSIYVSLPTRKRSHEQKPQEP